MPGTSTILLDTVQWDLVLDANGNIAVASEPYSLAQDAASAIRTFFGECFWDTLVGVPYMTQVLAQTPPLELMKSLFVAAAKTVVGVGSAQCFISEVSGRRISGQIQVTSAATGQVSAAIFSTTNPQGV